MLPFTGALLEEVAGRGGRRRSERARAECSGLSASDADWMRAISRDAAVAYVAAEFFGGTGTQAAVLRRGGTVALGPLAATMDATEAIPPAVLVPALREMVINVALGPPGVSTADAPDEFEALGLSRYRGAEEWATSPGAGP